MQIKSEKENSKDEAGQVLITAIVTCIMQGSSVMAVILHPQSVRMYKVTGAPGPTHLT